MIPARILGSSHALPGRVVTTAELVEQTRPGADPARLIAATGITHRHMAGVGARATDVAVDVLRRALDDAGVAAQALDRVIFVSSSGGDWALPATASAIIGALGIDGRADGFDMMNACVGFLTAFDLAARCVATGMEHVAVVTVELNSRLTDPSVPRAYTLFGDGAGAVILGRARGDEGIVSSYFANELADGPTIVMPHPGVVGTFVRPDFTTTGEHMTRLAIDGIVRATRRALERAGLGIADITHVLPHQPNGPLLQAILAALGVDPARVDIVVGEMGSLAAASIPVTLDRLRRSGRVRPGDAILMCSVGSPVVYGAAVYRAG